MHLPLHAEALNLIDFRAELTVLLSKTTSVDSLASAPPFQYNFLTSSEDREQLNAGKENDFMLSNTRDATIQKDAMN